MGNKERKAYALPPAFTTARRALGFGKMYVALAVFISFIAIVISYGAISAYASPSGYAGTAANSGNAISSIAGSAGKLVHPSSGIALIEVPLGVEAAVLLATPIVILFVYDKNNGVLEYLLSLGMSQFNIYTRYLKAALLITLMYVAAFALAELAYACIVLGSAAMAAAYASVLLVAILAVPVVAFIITAMMVFSSLQKSRAGGNQPLAVSLGMAVGAVPGFIFALTLPFAIAAVAEIVQAAAIALASLALFMLSGKLIKREKFLP